MMSQVPRHEDVDDSVESGRSEGRWARAIPLGILLLGLIEIIGLVVLAKLTSLWWVLAIIAFGWVVGIALVVAAGQQSFVRLRSAYRSLRGTGALNQHLSRPVFTLLAAACFFFPGVLTDLVGLVLLMIPVQKKVVQKVAGPYAGVSTRSIYRRSGGGVIDGEIVIDASGDGSHRAEGERRDPPPTIEP